MWFIGVEVEQETISAPPPKKNPGSAPEPVLTSLWRLVENFSHHLPSLRPAFVYIFL